MDANTEITIYNIQLSSFSFNITICPIVSKVKASFSQIYNVCKHYFLVIGNNPENYAKFQSE